MANEVNFPFLTGKTLTFAVYTVAGVERESGTSLTETPAGSGLYLGSPTTIVNGDNVVIKEGSVIVGGGQYYPPLVAGAKAFTYTVYTDEEAETGPIAGVRVWITTDEAGTNIIWSGTTDTNGVLREPGGSKPFLDEGTYYFWRIKAGKIFVNPDIETAS